MKVLKGVVCFLAAFPELLSGATGGGQVSAGACCALVKTAVLRAAGGTALLGDLLSFV